MKRVFAILLCALLVLSTAGCTGDAPQPTETVPPTTQPEVAVITDELIAQWDTIVKERRFEGIVCLTYRGQVVYQSVTGTNCLGEPLTLESPMFMNSVSKQFTAAAILMLRDQGKLSLDDTLDKYFPEYTIGKDITLQNLLAMRSGIVRDYIGVWDEVTMYEGMSAEEIDRAMMEWLYEQPLLFEPGSRTEYCNVNYNLLSYVVEQVSGMDYEDFIRQNIFEPLGMTHSGFYSEVTAHPEWGLTYDILYPQTNLGNWTQGCGSIISTAGDMDIWMTALPQGKVICEESYREMATLYSEDHFNYRGYGYGLINGPRDGWGHGGNNYYSSNYIHFNRDYGFNFFIATCNTPQHTPAQCEKVTLDFISYLLRAFDAAAQAQ